MTSVDLRFIDSVSLPVVFLAVVAITLAAIAVGFLVGRRHANESNHGPVGAVVGATSGLLAFMLAFTFGGAASRFDTRKELLLEEVNAIGTTYLRAGLLLEPHRTNARTLLREYVDARASVAVDPEAANLARRMAESEQIQARLWQDVAAMTTVERDSEVDGLYIASLNDVIDYHTRRVTVAFQYRVPPTIWVFLLLVTVLAMGALGYDFGLQGSRRYKVSAVLAVTFAAVIVLIADLDRPTQGFLKVSQQPMLDLQKYMQSEQATPKVP
jgi:hypothetical protein